MGIEHEHEAALNRMGERRELVPGSNNYLIDPNTGLVSRATVWTHGGVWFVDHFKPGGPVYNREHERAVMNKRTRATEARNEERCSNAGLAQR